MMTEGHADCFGKGRRAVIERGIGHLHAGQVADQALVFEDGLQSALRYLGLVRSVGRVELVPAQYVIDNRGDEVVVSAGAQEAGRVPHIEIGLAQSLELVHDLHFRYAWRQIEVGEAHAFGHGIVQVVEPVYSNRRQHLAAFILAMGYVGHQWLRS